jgi:hypothetical protein
MGCVPAGFAAAGAAQQGACGFHSWPVRQLMQLLKLVSVFFVGKCCPCVRELLMLHVASVGLLSRSVYTLYEGSTAGLLWLRQLPLWLHSC